MQDSGYFIKNLFLKHAGLNSAAQVVSTVGPIVCGIIAGKIFGSNGLAVVGLFSPMFFLASFFGTVIAGGSSALAARRLAKDDDRGVNEVYTSAILLAAAVGTALCLALIIFQNEILAFVVKDGNLLQHAEKYYMYTVPYIFFTVLTYMPLSWARLCGRPSLSIVLTAMLSGAAILFSLASVYILHMGIEGIALSQAAATALSFACVMIPLHRGKGALKFVRPRGFASASLRMVSMGSPGGLSRLYRFICGFALNSILFGVYGSVAVAIYAIINMLLRFITAFVSGVSSTVIPVVGVLSEERDTTSVRQLMRTAFLYGNAIIAAAAILITVLSKQIGDLFGLGGSDALNIFGYAAVFFGVYSVLFFNGGVFVAYYTAISKVFLANIITFAQDMLFLPLFAFVLRNFLDVRMIWAHLPLSGVAAAVVFITVLAFLKSRDKSVSIPLFINTRYEKEGKYISFSLSGDILRVSEAAEKITVFCEENELSPKQTMLISMSIEELITIIINNGTAGNKRDSIAVRLFLLEGSIVLRIRNSGKKFDPIAYYTENISGDIEKSLDLIGIKYIVEAAEVVYYRETFGVNNLVVVI